MLLLPKARGSVSSRYELPTLERKKIAFPCSLLPLKSFIPKKLRVQQDGGEVLSLG